MCAVFPVQAGAQSAVHDAEFRLIRESADSRNALKIISRLGKNPLRDIWILEALGSIQSDTALDGIFKAFASSDARVRTAAAFAAGQSLRDSRQAERYEPRLIQLLQGEKKAAVRGAILDALGRFAGTRGLEAAVRVLATTDSLRRAQAMSIARFAMRGIRSEDATSLLRRLIDGDHASWTKAAAAYALMRVGDSALLAPCRESLLRIARSADPPTRSFAGAALGATRSDDCVSEVVRLVVDSNRWVAVNALRALVKFRPSVSDDIQTIHHALHAAFLSPDYHRLKAALQSVPAIPSIDDTCSILIRQLIKTCPMADIRIDALRALAGAYPLLARPIVEELLRDSLPPPVAFEAIGIMATKQQQTDESLLQVLAGSVTGRNPDVCNAAIAAYGVCWRIARTKEKVVAFDSRDMLFENTMLHALNEHSLPEHQNPAGVQAVVEVLADTLFRSPVTIFALKDALQYFSSKDNVETLIVLIDALGRTGHAEAIPPLQQLASDPNRAVRAAAARALRALGAEVPRTDASPVRNDSFDWSSLQVFEKNPVAELRTNRGLILIELLIDDAPFTIAAFMSLARAGFYDGLLFHRVVPNFVVQGGDPRGDGTGGPPFTLRSEFSTRSFERGMVGIASAGKDTEGSQFFIMHSDHPHLDGRYTLFGRVIVGMDIVDRIEIGDRIESIRIRKAD